MTRMVGWIVTFLFTATAGAVISLVSYAALPGWLIGPDLGHDLAHSFLFGFFGVPAAAIAAGVGGFVSSRAFWLWGIAVALPAPVVDTVLTVRLVDRGLVEYSSSDQVGLALVSVVVFLNIAVAGTLGSALGAGLKMLGRRTLAGRVDGA